MLAVEHTCNALTTRARWKIENFSIVASRDDPKRMLFGGDFSLFKSRLRFCLRFDPTNLNEYGNKNYSSLFIVPRNLDNERPVTLEWKLWIENTDGRTIREQACIDCFWISLRSCTLDSKRVFSMPRGWGYSQFVSYTQLYPPSDFVKNDTIFVCCEICRDVSQPDFRPFELENKAAENMWLFHNQPDAEDECTIQIGMENFKVTLLIRDIQGVF